MSMRLALPFAALLALVGCAYILASVGSEALPLVVGWLAACLLVGLAWERATPTFRVVLATGLVPVCVVLTWEGGLYFLPSAVALMVASMSSRWHRRSGSPQAMSR